MFPVHDSYWVINNKKAIHLLKFSKWKIPSVIYGDRLKFWLKSSGDTNHVHMKRVTRVPKEKNDEHRTMVITEGAVSNDSYSLIFTIPLIGNKCNEICSYSKSWEEISFKNSKVIIILMNRKEMIKICLVSEFCCGSLLIRAIQRDVSHVPSHLALISSTTLSWGQL